MSITSFNVSFALSFKSFLSKSNNTSSGTWIFNSPSSSVLMNPVVFLHPLFVFLLSIKFPDDRLPFSRRLQLSSRSLHRMPCIYFVLSDENERALLVFQYNLHLL